MELIIAKDYREMSHQAATQVAANIIVKPELVLGLATGSTPVGTYEELIKMRKKGMVDFSKVTTFNLDEYIGLGPKDEASYHHFMFHNLFSGINVKRENINLLNGLAKDPEAECRRYEKAIRKAGGIDLQIVGIGQNGHIGFNEPCDVFPTVTHIVDLSEETRRVNAKFFKDKKKVPTQAISVGIGTIMKAKEIILLANTKEKAEAITEAIEGPVRPQVPASVLQLHPKSVMMLTEQAAKGLKRIFDKSSKFSYIEKKVL
ncbi:MAG: glucosamine-6-phosphate deaminase [Candidatus Omnitrophica bacterium]|nr:glucosamine-6-phosphate deaminase [Candidatus Omnitrophota bacterium]